MHTDELSSKLAFATTLHQQGKLEDAERAYRALLKIEPQHPVANHNLGILALQVGKPAIALPFFKFALETDPTQEQFWVSYIEALLHNGQEQQARQTYTNGQNKGVAGGLFSKLGERLKSPPPEIVQQLLTLFDQKKYRAAERSANAITRRYPQYGLAWKILGAVLLKLDQPAASLEAKQIAVQLLPADPEAHNNLGNSLMDAKRYAEAVNSFQHALRLQPNYLEVSNKLGTCLQHLGHLDHAQACYQQSLQLDPGHAESYKNLGNVFMQKRDYQNAQACYQAAISHAPNYADAHNNLGAAYFAAGLIDTAAPYYQRATELNPQSSGFAHNLGMVLWHEGRTEDALTQFEKNIKRPIDQWVIESAAYLAVIAYLSGQITACRAVIDRFGRAPGHQEVKLSVYFSYLDALMKEKTDRDVSGVHDANADPRLYVIGESHALSPHRLVVSLESTVYQCHSHWIIGCKQWHLGSKKNNQYQHAFNLILKKIPPRSTLLMTIGEIDCRPDEGILKAARKNPSLSLVEIVDTTVQSYLGFLFQATQKDGHRIILSGIPATNIPLHQLPHAVPDQLLTVIQRMNFVLEKEAIRLGFGFLDVFSLTNRGDGRATGEWHIDDVHLKPSAVIAAFHRMTIFPTIK